MANDINVEIILSLYTCECGLVYAVPNWMPSYSFQCPACAKRKYLELESKYNQAIENEYHLQKVINGLRGALNRKKR